MKRLPSAGLPACSLLLLLLVLILPVAGVDSSQPLPSGNQTMPQKPMVSASVSAAAPVVGDPVTVRGVAFGGNLSAGIEIWVFAGNYINVSSVPVAADGSFSRTYQTAGLSPAIYYVFVQSPGNDGQFGIGLQQTGVYSGQVVDTKSGELLINFTGTGSVQDEAAAKALSDSLNRAPIDDVYTKTTFQLVAPSGAASQTAAATRSPLSPVTIAAGIALAGMAAAYSRRQ
jgi:hypothetical protein